MNKEKRETFGDNIHVPNHKGGLYITHNGHKDDYVSIEEYLDTTLMNEHIPQSIIDECIEADSIWSMQVYPETPVGFYARYSATFEGLFK